MPLAEAMPDIETLLRPGAMRRDIGAQSGDKLSAEMQAPKRSRGTRRTVAPFNAAVEDVVGEERRRGRGSVSNRAGRFETQQRVDEDDGWGSLGALSAFKTDVTIEKPKTIISKNDSPDISFDRSINPYRGCEHGCVYCFARPSHAFMGLSPGLDFESKIFVKEGAADLLERELSAKSYRPKTIAIGTNTDPYQPLERTHRIMRSLLEVLARFNHPVGIVTKSALVMRDIDILGPMAAKGLAKVALSITTLDGGLARTMEPRASAPQKRLEAIGALAAAGIPTAVMVAPIIPAVNDAEIETILTRAKALGATEAGYVMLRLPLEVRDIFKEWLLANQPAKYRHVLSIVRALHGGKDYDAEWGKRMTGDGPYSWMIGRRFEVACQRLELNKARLKLRTDLFFAPKVPSAQLSLF